jgi:hypothetical protein
VRATTTFSFSMGPGLVLLAAGLFHRLQSTY